MAEIEFIDQTLRDGQQSYWGMRMRAGMVTGAAEHLDKAGYRVVDLTGGSFMTVQMRYLREDPWEWVDWIRRSLPNARLRSGRRTSAIGRFGLSPEPILDLFIATLIKHGVTSFWFYDCLYNMDKLERATRAAAAAGAEEVIPAIMFGISPLHTDEYFADKVRQMVAWDVADGIYFEDAAGILTPERAATLVPALVEAAQGLPLEMHCHNTTGLAPLNYLESIKHGVRILHTASLPMANGPSLPSTEMMVQNLEVAGHSSSIDCDRLGPIADHFTRVARQEGFAHGTPNEYSLHVYAHQLPGGMTGTFKAQLAQYDMEDRLDEVLEECVRVREEMGHPVSATPFSQLIGTQAVINVTTGERYGVCADEIILYVLGHYGDPPAPIDETVKDKILSTPRGKEMLAFQPPDQTVEELRLQYGGKHLSDEELLRRYLAPAEDVEAMKQAGPLRRTYDFEDDLSISDVVKDILTMTRPGAVRLRSPDFSFDLHRHSH